MAEETEDSSQEEALSLEEGGSTKVPAMAYGETGFTGLATLGGQVFENCQHELRWPYAYKTYKDMAADGAVHPSLDFVESKIAEASWVVRIPKNAPKELEANLKFWKTYLEQVMTDMTHSWSSMIKEAASFNRYGWSALEIVLRYRNKKYGSKFDDGYVGVKKLPIRSQGTIQKWEWKNKGRDIDGMWQRCVVPMSSGLTTVGRDGWELLQATGLQEFNLKFIKREKFLLFRHNAQNESPCGESPLAGVWRSWKYKTAYEESQAISVAQDSNAFKILYLPPEYLQEDADEDRKKSFEMYKRMLEKAHQAKQSGFILPMLTDSDGNKMFEFEIKNVGGTKSYDVNAIIQSYSREIQVGLFADVLSLGGGSGGSYSLSESKVSIMDLAVKSRLNEIKDQLNHQLVKTLFEQNGWSSAVTPFFDFELPNMETLDNKSKAWQRTAATNLLPRTPQVINQVLRDLGVDYQIDDDMSQEDLIKLLDPFNTGMTSESGGGLVSGMPNSNGSGIGDSGDSSVSNGENT